MAMQGSSHLGREAGMGQTPPVRLMLCLRARDGGENETAAGLGRMDQD